MLFAIFVKVGVPECPALYLYADNGQEFTVKPPSNNFSTLPYTKDAWKAQVVPGGLRVNGNNYKYLYYTVKPDGKADPEISNGWVVSPEEFDKLSKDFLRSVGLTKSESRDISEYLSSVLPYS